MSDKETIAWLEKKAKEIRKEILISLTGAASGHTGGSLGLADIFTVLYFYKMRYRSAEPDWDDRDRLVLSIGHVAPVLYVSLAHAGFFPKEELATLRKLGSRLQGHPSRDRGLPGIELAAGSLGQGLSVAVGMALAASMDHKQHKIVAIMGDGELQEGSIWEAAMSAAHHKLGNIIAIIDRNKQQIDGSTSRVMEIEPLCDKWRSFGWVVKECNGNDIRDIINTLNDSWRSTARPTVIIANTIMGKGVPAIENDHTWHGRVPDKKDLVDFLNALR
ncbi:MAG: transketolase [Bacteroidales bacterium]|nr:transketolase [Bacteroidales bacterium]